MMHVGTSLLVALLVVACGGAPPASSPARGAAHQDTDGQGGGPGSKEFELQDSSTAGSAHGVAPSKIKATDTHAAVKFFVVDKSKNEPIPGIVISLQDAAGNKYYTEETDELGYGEVLVPIGREYQVVYLSLGRKDVTAKVKVPDEPRQNIKLTLRYKPIEPAVASASASANAEASTSAEPAAAPSFRLEEVNFESGSAELLPESRERLDGVVEYMTHKKAVRIEIAGHTDNVGAAKKNKALSLKRAQAVRAYLIEQGIDGDRIEAVGHGDERPVASNDTEAGRRQNRRIEAREL